MVTCVMQTEIVDRTGIRMARINEVLFKFIGSHRPDVLK